MGQTGFCKTLPFPAKILQKSAVFCENLQLRNAAIPRGKKRKSAKISEKLQIDVEKIHHRGKREVCTSSYQSLSKSDVSPYGRTSSRL